MKSWTADGIAHHAVNDKRANGTAPEHASYGSFISFSYPDGNEWFVQEVTERAPGRWSPIEIDSPLLNWLYL